MSEISLDRYKDLVRAAEASVLEAIKLKEVRKSNVPIMMDDDGTRFPMSYPDMQVRESTKEGLYRQQVSAFCDGMLSLCKASSFTLDSSRMKEFEDVFDLYKSRCPYESMLFLQEYKKAFKNVPQQVNSMYEALLRGEDQEVQTRGAAYKSKEKSDVLSVGILKDAVSHSVRKLSSSN